MEFKTLVLSATLAAEVDELLNRVGRGDLCAFRELHDATAHRVFGFARAVVLDVTRAQDITQDAYLDIWRRAPRFVPQACSAIGWILMITHARAVDHIRTSERIRKHDQIAIQLSAHGADYDHTVEKVLTSHETTPYLEAALATLTHLQRQAIQLTYWDNLTGPEASRMLDISLSAFKARLHGAMVALRAAHLGTARAAR